MTRARTTRCKQERDAKKLAEARWKLAVAGEGASAARPISVVSASQIEPHARSLPCPSCEVSFHVLEHEARAGLREVRVRCPRCAREMTLHFRLEKLN